MSDGTEGRVRQLERELALTATALAAAETRLAATLTSHREMERALLDAERRYRTLVESSTDIVYITDPRRFRYVSPAMKTILGYEPSELIGKETAPLVHPEDRPLLTAEIERALASKSPTATVKFRALHADGTYRILEGFARNCLDEPSIAGLVVNVRDVTERERVLEALRLGEARLRGVFDAALNGMLILDDEARIIDINAAAIRLLRVERNAAIGRKTYEVVSSADGHDARWTAFQRTGRVDRDVVLGTGDDQRFVEVRGIANIFPGGHLAIFHDITERRAAERALAESERRFRLLVESSADVVYITVDRKFVYVSPAMKGVLGYEAEELLGQDSLSLIDPQHVEMVARMRSDFVADAARSGTQLKLRMRHKDGTYRVTEMVVRRFVDEPTIGGFVINFHDVTERERALEDLRQSEASLRESQLKLEKAQAIGHIGSWAIDPYGPDAIVEASPEMLRIYGIDPATYDGHARNFRERLHPADWEVGNAVTAHAAETGGPFMYDARIMREGEVKAWLHIEGIAERGEAGKGARMMGTTLDITAMKRAEEELRVSEARYRRILETTNEGVVLVDARRVVTFVNRQLAETLGYSAEEMIGRPTAQFTAMGESGAHEQHYTELHRGLPQRMDREFRKKDGSTIWLSVASTPLLDENGAYDGALGMLTDATERRRAERAEQSLREVEEQLRQAQKLEALGQLAGGVAHDFNNILSVILGYTSILTQELPAQDPVRADIAEIHEAGVRASDLTQQLLAFSRKQVRQPRIVDIHAAVAKTEKMLRRLLGEDIDLQLGDPSKPMVVKVDPGQLEQVLLNLAVNARDAMPGGGRFVIEMRPEQLGEDDARTIDVAPGAYVALLVSDTGTGMDESVLTHLFEPFFTTKEKGKGTGLGLSTVFGIVKQSAGHITVRSKPGEGTTFRILLPRTDSPAETAGAHRSEGSPAQASEIVLLVEDEAQVRTLVRTVLRRAGYHVLEAATPGEAILVSEQHDGKIDLLLTDIVMPRMGGHTLALRLREQRPDMKVLYMSGYTDDTVLRHGVELGHLAFLAKPFTPATLCAKVREVVDS